MRKATYLLGLTLVFAFVVLPGCKKEKTVDDDTSTDKLVVVKRSTGVMYTVNKTSGDLTQVMSLTYNSEPLTGLRGLVYDSETDKCYAGATNQGNGNFYSINISSGVATLLNDNAEEAWDAIADLVIAPDDNILAVIYSNVVSNSALAVFNKSTGESGTHKALLAAGSQDDMWSTGGLIYGASQSQLIVGSNNHIFVSNLDGVISNILPLEYTANIDDEEIYVMDMEKVGSNVFALVYEYNDETQYLVKVNTSTGDLTEVKLMATGSNSDLYHCLAKIPENKLN